MFKIRHQHCHNKVHTTVYERNAFMLEGVWKYVEERDEYFQYNFYNWGWGAYQSELSGYFWSDNFKIYDNHEIKYNLHPALPHMIAYHLHCNLNHAMPLSFHL